MLDRPTVVDTPDADWAQRAEPTIARFTAAWANKSRPKVADYLDVPVEYRGKLAAALARIDLDHRLRIGEEARAEDYAAITELALSDHFDDVIRAEYGFRLRHEPNLNVNEFVRRFPDRVDCLQSKIPPSSEWGSSRTLDGAPPTPVVARPARVYEDIGTTIGGRYRLISQLGQGGMGTVWLAEQSEPVRRQVAIKLIKAGLDYDMVFARFEAERQALAMMDHPNIAKVFDAGATEDGRPYFVMELVPGTPINKYCDEHRLTLKQRIKLFISVCLAVQHAHQKGIIHRDLKPDNVLVASIDNKAVPKVIDFGVAKATGPRLMDATMQTEMGAVIGTLEYMAPEQVATKDNDIDTRSDIYSLGVMLYELLTGALPFARRDLPGITILELVRMLREVEPAKPSAKLATIANADKIATLRQSDAPRLRKTVGGELDWITMKCLEKDRARRYETANGLAADLRRYLADEPVVASPPSTAYRVQKFVRRNKQAVVAAILLFTALCAGIAGTTWGLVKARRALIESQRQTNIAKAVNEFFQNDILRQADSSQQAERGFDQDPNISVKIALDRAASRIGNRFADEPLVEAAIRFAIGEAYGGVGAAATGVTHLEQSRQLRRQWLGPDHADIRSTEMALALAYQNSGQISEAIKLLADLRQRCESTLGPDHPEMLQLLNDLGLAYRDVKDYKQAITLLETARDRQLSVRGADDEGTLNAQNNLALAYYDARRIDQAIPLFEQVRDKWTVALGPTAPRTRKVQNNLALAYQAAGRIDEAIPLFEQLRDSYIKARGPDHPDTLQAINNLALAYAPAGRRDDAIAMFQLARNRLQVTQPAELPLARSVAANLAIALREAGQFDRALDVLHDLLTVQTRILDVDHLDRGNTMAAIGYCLLKLGRAAPAEPVLRECLRIRTMHMPNEWITFYTQAQVGACLLELKRYDDAEPLLKTGYAGMKERLPSIPRAAWVRLAEAAERLQQLAEANKQLEVAAEWKKAADQWRAGTPPE